MAASMGDQAGRRNPSLWSCARLPSKIAFLSTDAFLVELSGVDRAAGTGSPADRRWRISRLKGAHSCRKKRMRHLDPPWPDATLKVTALAAATSVLAACSAVALGPLAFVVPVGIIALILLARYPAVLFVAYIYVGIFKGEALLRSLPFDITAVLGVLLALVCFIRLISGRVRHPPMLMLVPMVVIGILMAISLTYTPGQVYDYGLEKVAKYFSLTALAALAPFFIIEDRRDLKLLLIAIVALAGFGAVVSLLNPGSVEQTGRVEFGGHKNTIFTSRLLCSGALVLLLAPRLLGLGRNLSVTAVAASIAILAVSASIGSRGPILSFGFAVACVIAASALRNPRQLVPVIALVAAAIAVFPFVSLPETSRERLEEAVKNPTKSLQEDGRAILYRQAFELIDRDPLTGFGSGGFFLYSYVLLNQEEKYPHNIFLELWSENGIVAPLALAVSVLMLILMLFKRAWNASGPHDRRLLYIFAGLFLFNLFAVQFSGDINDNRAFWAAFGVAWLLAQYGVPAREAAPDPRSP